MTTPLDVIDDPHVPARSSWTVYLSWLLIILCVGYIGFRVFQKSKTGSTAMAAQLELNCRYILGVTKILPTPPEPLIEGLKKQVAMPVDRLIATPVLAEIGKKEAAIQYLDETSLDKLNPAMLKARATLLTIYREGVNGVTKDDALNLENELGWSGRLALTWQMPEDSPQRRDVINAAKRTATTLVAAFVVILILLGLGVVMGIVALVLRLTGTIQTRYVPDLPPLAPYVEGFALFLVLYVGTSFIRPVIERLGIAGLVLMQLAIMATAFWPLLRGVRWGDYRRAVGWHRGTGVFTEIGCGFMGYLAGLPIVALGAAITFALIKFTHAEQPIHPIAGETGGGILGALLLYLAAAVLAPLMEETLFRGMLYHHVRSKLPWVISALLVGLIFASIHPQGWAAIPVLGSIGFILAMIREWRGSLIASMTAHALNNGMLITMLIFATR